MTTQQPTGTQPKNGSTVEPNWWVRMWIWFDEWECKWFPWFPPDAFAFGIVLLALLIGGLIDYRLGFGNTVSFCLTGFLLIMSYMMVRVAILSRQIPKRSTDGADLSSREQEPLSHIFARVFFDLLVSVVAGISVSYLLKVNNPTDQGSIATNIGPGVAFGSVLFLTQMLARACVTAATAGRLVRQLADSTDLLDEKAEKLDKSLSGLEVSRESFERNLGQADLARAALLAFELRDDRHFLDKKNKKVIQSASAAANAGVRLIQAAALAGMQLLNREDSTTSDSARLLSDAWWNFIRSYYQEEIFDVANWEVATNVRNYAFSAISLIRSCLDSLGKDHNHQILVISVSPFNPKDLYNWPNGTASSRFYHEAEFFAIYRRVLADFVTGDSRLLPMRVALAAPEQPIQITPPPQTFGIDQGHGWPLDPIWKLRLDLARHHVFALPYSFPIKPQFNNRATKSANDKLGKTFRVSALDKLRSADHILFTPFLTALKPPSDTPPSEAPVTDAQYDAWQKRVQPVTNKDFNFAWWKSVPDWTNSLRADWKVIQDVAFNELIKAATSLHKGDFSDEDAQYVQTIIDTQDATQVALLFESLVERMDANVPRETAEKLIHALKTIHKRHKNGGTEEPDFLARLLDICHSADAQLRLARLCAQKPRPKIELRSSFGTALGPFESWLLSFVIRRHGETLCKDCNGALIPLWWAFANDFLGWRPGGAIASDAPAAKTVPGSEEPQYWPPCEYLAEAIKRYEQQFRLCVVRRSQDYTQEKLEKEGLTREKIASDPRFTMHPEEGFHPEFILLARAPAIPNGANRSWDMDNNWESVEPIAMLTTTMSDPFQTCRVELTFGHDEKAKEHFKWIKNMFTHPQVLQENKDFRDALVKEINEVYAQQAAP